jgi:hypothetical protein
MLGRVVTTKVEMGILIIIITIIEVMEEVIGGEGIILEWGIEDLLIR